MTVYCRRRCEDCSLTPLVPPKRTPPHHPPLPSLSLAMGFVLQTTKALLKHLVAFLEAPGLRYKTLNDAIESCRPAGASDAAFHHALRRLLLFRDLGDGRCCLFPSPGPAITCCCFLRPVITCS